MSPTSVRRMLAAMDYSLQGNRKTREGTQHPDRDGQFRHIADRVNARKRRGEPAISVDTKKKEVLGNLKNAGQTYRPHGDPQTVKTHDFPDPKLGKAVPYGVYDIHGTRPACRWASATTRPSSPWVRSAVGGRNWAGNAMRTRSGSW